MVTLKEVAKACGVSAATVSNVLNGKSKASEETCAKVKETVKQMGYQPNYMAQGLRAKKTRTIAIIAEDLNQFTTPFVVESAMAELEKRGYRTILQNMRMYGRWKDTWYDSNRTLWSILEPALQECRSIMADGIVYIAGHGRKITCIPEDYPIPIVMAYAYAMNEHIPSVVIDDEQAAYEIGKYLIGKGHRKIAVLVGRQDNIHSQLRLKGFQRAEFEMGVLFNPELVAVGNWNREDGRRAAEKLADSDITAVFSMNDEMAAGVYDVFEAHGRKVGEDISIVGFDNESIAQYFRPGLTTTALPLNTIGHKAAELLTDWLERDTETDKRVGMDPVVYYEKCTFIERNSVKQIAEA